MINRKPLEKRHWYFATRLLIFGGICFTNLGFGQGIPELKDSLKRSLHDTVKSRLLEEIAWKYLDSNLDSTIFFARRALKYAYKYQQNQVVAYALADISNCYKAKGEYDSSKAYLLRSIDYRMRSGNERDIGSGKNLFGLLRLNQGKFDEAITAFSDGIAYVKGKGFDDIEAGLWDGIGQALLGLGRHSESLVAYNKSLKLNRDRGDPVAIAKSLQNIGNYFQATHRAVPALEAYKEAEEIYREVNLPLGVAQILMNAGVVWYQLGQADSAFFYLNRSLRISEDTGNDELLHDLYNNLALVSALRGRYSEAERYFKLDLAYCIAHDRWIKTGKTKINLAELYLKQGRFKEALQMLKGIEEKAKIPVNLKLDTYDIRNQAYAGLGSYEEAYTWSGKHRILADSINDMMKSVQDLNDKYLSEKAARSRAVHEARANDAKLAQAVAENKTRTIQIIATISVFSLVAIGFFFFFRGQRFKIRSLVAEAQVANAREEIRTKLQNAELEALRLSMATQERERNRIARNLHDSLGSKLSLVQMSFQTIQKHIGDIPDKTRLQYENAVIHLDEACEEVRQISRNMLAGDLAHFGLQMALERFCHQVDQTCAIRIEFVASGNPDQLSADIESHLYAMVRTIMENILRHSEAQSCEVRLCYEPNGIQVGIRDDGKGFDMEKLGSTRGVGLNNVRDRIEQINGKLELKTSLGHGTSILIKVPKTK